MVRLKPVGTTLKTCLNIRLVKCCRVLLPRSHLHVKLSRIRGTQGDFSGEKERDVDPVTATR